MTVEVRDHHSGCAYFQTCSCMCTIEIETQLSHFATLASMPPTMIEAFSGAVPLAIKNAGE